MNPKFRHELLELSEVQEVAVLVLVERLLGSLFAAQNDVALFIFNWVDEIHHESDLLKTCHQI
jgi:hypothetical protein